jgi:DNA gyrase subunit B
MEFSEKDIQVLSFVESVRKRPGMYIGNISAESLRNILQYLLDFVLRQRPIAKALAISIEDELTFEFTTSEPVQFEAQADGKILLIDVVGYRPVGDLVFMVLSALSQSMTIQFATKDGNHSMQLSKGERKELTNTDHASFKVRCTLDSEIFSGKVFEPLATRNLLERLSFFYPATQFSYSDFKQNKTWRFHEPGGLKAFFSHRLLLYTPRHEPIIIEAVAGDRRIEIIFALHAWEDGELHAFVNGHRTVDRKGHHIGGFLNGIQAALKKVDVNEVYNRNEIRRGFLTIISLMLPEDSISWNASFRNMNFANKKIGEWIEQVTQEAVGRELNQNKRFRQLIEMGRNRIFPE